MGDWREVSLGDVLTLQRGFDLPARDRVDGPVPIVSSSGVTGRHTVAKAEPPGVVIGRYGSLGAVHWITEPYWPLNTSLWVKDFKGNDPRYVSYLLKTISVDGSSASAIPGVNRNHLHRLPTRVPSVASQEKIAAALASFDDLIEINKRRIELLEQLARSIYREWFVRLRFPGHEDARFCDSELGGVPEGWATRSVSSLGSFLNGYPFKPSQWGTEGLPIIKIKELKQGVTVHTPRYRGGELPPKYVVDPGDLLFSWSADLGIYLWAGERGLLNQHLFKVTSTSEASREYLFHALHDALPHFRARAQGTTMKHIKRSALAEVSVLVPQTKLMSRFTDAATPIHAAALALRRSSLRLAHTRDLLLPRLVTGRLDISDIDLGDLLPAEAA